MNKRYIDFVPKAKGTGAKMPAAGAGAGASATEAGAARGVANVRRPQSTGAVARSPRAMAKPRVTEVTRTRVRQEEVRLEEIFAERPTEAGTQKFGVIEDFSGKFVSTEVEKRPLSASADAAAAKAKKIPRISLIGKSKSKMAKAEGVAEAKKSAKSTGAKAENAKVGSEKGAMAGTTNGVASSVAKGAASKKTENPLAKMKIPERPFVNMEKVEKRPLSRNVYQPRKVVVPKEEPQGPITIIEKPEKDSRIGLIVTIIITIILGAAAGTVAFLLLPK